MENQNWMVVALKIVKAKKTLVRVWTGEFTLSIGPLWEGRGLSQNREALQKKRGNQVQYKLLLIKQSVSFTTLLHVSSFNKDAGCVEFFYIY
jgi:hypothetical protein